MTAVDLVVSILRDLDKDNSPLPASYLYNEGWMLRLILRSIADGCLRRKNYAI